MCESAVLRFTLEGESEGQQIVLLNAGGVSFFFFFEYDVIMKI